MAHFRRAEVLRSVVVIFATLIWVLIFELSAKAGDTLEIQAHNDTEIEWFGNFDEKVNLPNDTISIRQVKLNLTIECNDQSCGFEANPLRIQVLKPTDDFDTSKQEQPIFKVNGEVVDTFRFSFTPTYQYYFDSVSGQMDSVRNDSLEVVRFTDNDNPSIPTDTLYVWPAGYSNPIFDSMGNQTGQKYVAPDTFWTLDHHVYHNIDQNFDSYELGRIQTPFGGYMDSEVKGFDKNWSHTYEFDVSDFSTILRDSVIIRLRNEGWPSNYKSSLSMEYVKGQPNREVDSVRSLYLGSFPYVDQFRIDSMLSSTNFQIPKNVDAAKLKLIISGHGSRNNKDCGAFCKKRYFVNIDGQEVFNKAIWREDCGINPIYPQDGDWVTNRANWCPGMKTQSHDLVLNKKWLDGNRHSLDLSLQPIQWSGIEPPYYLISAQLVTYDSIPKRDIAIEEILAPAQKDEFARKNPVVLNPEIRIKNEGSQPINSVQIRYGMTEGNLLTFNWSRKLLPMQARDIKLPAEPNWLGTGEKFKVKLKSNIGSNEEHQANNEAYSTIKAPFTLPPSFVLNFRSNFKADENQVEIRDAKGRIHYERGDFIPNSTHKDTIELVQGERFRLVLTDKGGDGLDYPFQNEGQGAFNIMSPYRNDTIKSFTGNFGDSLTFEFQVVRSTNRIEARSQKQNGITIEPNPAQDQVHLHFEEINEDEVKVQVINVAGKKVYQKNGVETGLSFQIDTKSIEPGIYFVRVQGSNRWFSEKLLVK